MKKILVIMTVLLSCSFALLANGETEQFLLNNFTQPSQGASVVNYTGNSYSSQINAGAEIIARDMASLERLYKYLDKNYLYDIDYDAVYEAMATAMFEALGDKYTYYIGEEESDDYEEQTFGVYGGLGFYFTKNYLEYQDPDDESTIYCNITQVFPNTPSSRAGVKAHDMIIAIDGESTADFTANECARKMKGEVGTKVDITIKRAESVFTLSLVREQITVPTVEYCMIDENIGYMRILEFASSTYTTIKDALSDLASKGMKGLVLDLRDNPGGDVDATLQIADLFIDDSRLLSVSYKDSSKNITFKSNSGTVVDPSVDIAILINSGTASSAEILSSTMRDNGRAKLFGSTTFGKGVMQVVSSFGDGYVSITTASFVPPSGNEIHQQGVKPDFEIDDLVIADDEVDAYADLINGTRISDFVSQNPDFTSENVQKFVSEASDTGLRTEILQILVRNEYYLKMDEEPLFDLEYDSVCRAAYQYLKNEVL